MNQNSRFNSNEAMFLTMDEEEYAQAFRSHGWGEHAIEMELDLLRKLKDGFKARQDAAITPDVPYVDDEGNPMLDELEQALERSRKRRQAPS